MVYPSEQTEAQYNSVYDITCPEWIILNGVYDRQIRDSFSESGSENLLKKYGIDEASIVCLFVGSNFKENAEAANFLASMAETTGDGPDVHALIIGKVGDSIKTGGSNVTTTGFVNDLKAHYDLADIGFNMIRRPEGGVSFKLLEYLSRGIPVVTSREGAYG